MKNILQRFFSVLTACIAPLQALAESEAARSTSIDAFSMMNILNMVMGLLVVVALILGLAWVLKKYGRLPGNNLVDMKILGGLSLGTREKALLIEVDNVRLLVGVAPGHIQTLHVMSEKEKSAASFDNALSQAVEKTE